jgi:intermediate peptidase
VYLDLCSRHGKYPGAVTFPIRCGRSLGPNGQYQLPVMALLADFGLGRPESICLTYRELRTLMHELGHCCHNLASRTRYQHLWGTRCAQDMVEVPSHLWEHFAVDPATLGMLARHRTTRDRLPAEAAQQLVAARRMFSALELQGQVLLALVDQHYFGASSAAAAMAAEEAAVSGAHGQPDTSLVWAATARRFSSIPHPLGTHPQARVGHFTVYGGSYYSYVYARFLSAAVWNQYLEGRSLDREAGDAVWQKLLAPGGSVEPADMVCGLLGTSALQQVPSGGWALRLDESTVARVRQSF